MLDIAAYQQFANERFHPPPLVADIFTVERKAELSKLCILLNIEFPKNLDILNVHNLLQFLEEKLYLKIYHNNMLSLNIVKSR